MIDSCALKLLGGLAWLSVSGVPAAQEQPLTVADFVEPTGVFSFAAEVPLALPGRASRSDSSDGVKLFELGRRLFMDTLLSADGSTACATCHQPEHGFAQPQKLAVGIAGRIGELHAPALFNRGWGKSQRWDGSTETVEQFVLEPIESAEELGSTVDAVLAKLADEVGYAEAFGGVFGRSDDVGAPGSWRPTRDQLARALAGYVNGLVLGDSPVDAFLRGERSAMTVAERAGMWIWESKGACWRCHPRPLFSDEGFHNTGVGRDVDGIAPAARMRVTGEVADRGKFKTPTLRGVALNPPYMHDGSLATLEDVVQFYRDGGGDNPNLSPLLRPLELTDREASNLVAFLRALSRTRTYAAARQTR